MEEQLTALSRKLVRTLHQDSLDLRAAWEKRPGRWCCSGARLAHALPVMVAGGEWGRFRGRMVCCPGMPGWARELAGAPM